MTPVSLRLATFLAPNMLPVYRFIAGYVGQKLAVATELVTGATFSQFAEGQTDAGFICGLPYVRLRDEMPPPVELLAAPVLQGERFQGRPIYFSDIIVRADSPFTSFADLRGRSWVYNEPYSQSGYGILRYHLASLGEDETYFSRLSASGYHQRSIRLVAQGKVDASAIDCQVLAVEMRDHPRLARQLRIIDALGPSTIQPVVAATRLPGRLKADLQAVLLAMGDDPAARQQLANGFIDRFVPVADQTYDDIRHMLAATKRQAEW